MDRRDFLKWTGISTAALLMPWDVYGGNRLDLCASNMNLLKSKNKFRLAIWGDPQVAFWAPEYEFMKYGSNSQSNTFVRCWNEVNPRLAKAVTLTNELTPDFVVTLGDNVHGEILPKISNLNLILHGKITMPII